LITVTSANLSGVMDRVSDIRRDVWPSEFEVIDKEGIFRLLHYIPVKAQKYRTPILMVFAIINRPYILDLRKDISVVAKYLNAGLDVYMIDWGYPTTADRYLDLDDYIDFLDKSVENIKERQEVDQVVMHGYCLGGTLCTAYAAVRPQNIRSLLLQATPIDFNTNNTMAVWARGLDPDKIVEFKLKGTPGFPVNVERLVEELERSFFHISMADESSYVDLAQIEKYTGEHTVRSEFVKRIFTRMNQTEDEREKEILKLALLKGLAAFQRGE